MSVFRADLHIHSRFSRATSSKLTLPFLAFWANTKGLDVLGTGDITHPAWRRELKQQLYYDEQTGLYRLHEQNALPDSATLPDSLSHLRTSHRPTYFMLQGEISSIYKRDGKVRKIHSLVFFPTFHAADMFCAQLEKIGNITSDGRPIIGLDVKDLLDMVLAVHPHSFLVPAHIWTPWFSLFGAKSGFDSLEACFGDLTPEIFALETGLSSDPAMNRLWSALDACTLISCSDAHSGENIGRETTLFTGTIEYTGILGALAHRSASRCASLVSPATQYVGTIELYPEEGKYFLDGHKKCAFSCQSTDTTHVHDRCPVCNQPMTRGVLSRVQQLADRDTPVYPDNAQTISLVPLQEILSELLQAGAKTKKVQTAYTLLITIFGSELALLQDVAEQDIASFYPLLAKAITRMRQGEVYRVAGYDGVYGSIHMFTDQERSTFPDSGATLKTLMHKACSGVKTGVHT